MEFYAIGKRYEANTFWDFKNKEFISHLNAGCLLPSKTLTENLLYENFGMYEYDIIKVKVTGNVDFKVKAGVDW